MKRALLALLLAAGCDGGGESGVFIALQRDFAGFRGWQKTFLGDGPLEGHPAGPRYGYVKQPLAAGEKKYPMGDIIVKSVEVMADEQSWDLFAMAKRGGNFNSGGAINWEFFTLQITASGAPVILVRGIDATEVSNAMGHGYVGATGNFIRCNGCHGDPVQAKTDYILSPQFQPGWNGVLPDLSETEFDGGTD